MRLTRKTAAALAIWPTLSVLTRVSLLSMVREDGIRMALSQRPVIRFSLLTREWIYKKVWKGEALHVKSNFLAPANLVSRLQIKSMNWIDPTSLRNSTVR